MNSRVVREFVLSIWLSLSCGIAYSQVTETVAFDIGIVPYVSVQVLDGETDTMMEGAAVFLSFGTDTLKAVTGAFGVADFLSHPFRNADTVTVQVSFLGYRDVVHRQAMKPRLSLEVRMEEDPQRLNAIIVEDDHIAMIRNGDTVVYNAAAFTTMAGDRLVDLLRKLPGISMDDGVLTAGGMPVSKILVNGTMLFNSNMAAALEMMESKDIKNVKVYDEHAQDRLVERDTLGRKERVVDVETKRPFTKAQELVLLALGGVFVDNGDESVDDWAGGVDGTWRSFAEGRPSYDLQVGAGHNYETGGENHMAVSPLDNAGADFSVEHRKQFRSSMFHTVRLRADKSGSMSSSEDVYSATEAFSSRTDRRSTEGRRSALSAMYIGRQGFTVRENTSITVGLNFSYDRTDRLDADDMYSVTDGTAFRTGVRDRNLHGLYGFGAEVGIEHHFRKEGRKISAGINYNGKAGNGSGERVDTMRMSTSPQWLATDTDEKSDRFGLSVSYDEPLVGSRLRLSLSYGMEGDFSVMRRTAFDELQQQTDVLNTMDYTHRDIVNNASAGLKLNLMQKGLSMSAKAVYTRSDQLRDEYFPASYSRPASYSQISPELSLSYFRNGISLNLNYTESASIPSVEQTRGVLDDASPLFLRAGNPDLKASRIRTLMANVSLTSAKCSSSWDMNIMMLGVSDCAVNRTVYFMEDTWLPQYGYTADAGSQLTVPVNAGGRTYFSTRIGWKGYSNVLKSSFGAGPGYSSDINPFMTGDVLRKNVRHELNFNFNFTGGFSRYFELGIQSVSGIGRSIIDGSTAYDFFRENLYVSARGSFLKRFRIMSVLNYNMMKTTTAGLEYDIVRWDASLSYRFGNGGRSELSLACNDILDRNRQIYIAVLDGYVRTDRRQVFGRSITMSYKFTFR